MIFIHPLDTPLAKKNCSQPSESKDVVFASALIDKYSALLYRTKCTENVMYLFANTRGFLQGDDLRPPCRWPDGQLEAEAGR